jgi:hypothetical protein
MRANSEHDKPFWFLDSVRVFLRVTKGRYIHVVGLINLFLGTMPDEDGLDT